MEITFSGSLKMSTQREYSTYDSNDNEITVEYDLFPAEKRTWDYPGCPAELQITDILIGSKSIIDSYDDSMLSKLEDNIWDSL